jgi:hypothetical protein
MSPNAKHNLIWFVPVILLRTPLLLPLVILIKLGEACERLYDSIEPHLPGLRG